MASLLNMKSIAGLIFFGTCESWRHFGIVKINATENK